MNINNFEMAKPIVQIFILILFVSYSVACGPNQQILDSAKPSPTPPNKAAVTNDENREMRLPEREIEAMRNADFNFIYVFKRKDGGPLDGDDKKFMNANTPPEINRRSLSGDGKALITGSNFRFPPKNLQLLTGRFAFEDHSKPGSEINGANNNFDK